MTNLLSLPVLSGNRRDAWRNHALLARLPVKNFCAEHYLCSTDSIHHMCSNVNI